jgi:hypothetical protein
MNKRSRISAVDDEEDRITRRDGRYSTLDACLKFKFYKASLKRKVAIAHAVLLQLLFQGLSDCVFTWLKRLSESGKHARKGPRLWSYPPCSGEVRRRGDFPL